MAPCSPCPYPPSTVHSLLSYFSCAACSQRLIAPWCWQILIWLFQFCYIPTRSTIIAAGAVARSVTQVSKLWILTSCWTEAASVCHRVEKATLGLTTSMQFLCRQLSSSWTMSWWLHLSKTPSEADGSFPCRKWDFSITFHPFQSKHLSSPGSTRLVRLGKP